MHFLLYVYTTKRQKSVKRIACYRRCSASLLTWTLFFSSFLLHYSDDQPLLFEYKCSLFLNYHLLQGFRLNRSVKKKNFFIVDIFSNEICICMILYQSLFYDSLSISIKKWCIGMFLSVANVNKFI